MVEETVKIESEGFGTGLLVSPTKYMHEALTASTHTLSLCVDVEALLWQPAGAFVLTTQFYPQEARPVFRLISLPRRCGYICFS